jgi:hypothetical protein
LLFQNGMRSFNSAQNKAVSKTMLLIGKKLKSYRQETGKKLSKRWNADRVQASTIPKRLVATCYCKELNKYTG